MSSAVWCWRVTINTIHGISFNLLEVVQQGDVVGERSIRPAIYMDAH